MKNKILTAVVIFCVFFSVSSLGACNPKTEEVVEEVEPAMECIDIRDYWAAHPEEYARKMAIYDMASTAGRICPQGASDRALSAVMYVIYNRYRTAGFPNTISGVCEQPNQWEYRSEAYITTALNALAEKNLNTWESGECCQLPCNRDVLFFNTTENGLELMYKFGGEVVQTIGWDE